MGMGKGSEYYLSWDELLLLYIRGGSEGGRGFRSIKKYFRVSRIF